MNSEGSASAAAAHCHNGYMAFGKKQRYVEVFQCSGEEMSTYLSGAVPQLPSPGMEPQSLPQFEAGEYYFPQPAVKHPVFSVPPPGYPQWSTEGFPSTVSSAKTTTTDALPSAPKTSELELLPPHDMYQYAYPAQNPFYLLPRIQPLTYFPKPVFPPLLMPQLTPLGMGLLGVKRSWEQAFPMEGPLHAAKRWQGAVPSPGYYHHDL